MTDTATSRATASAPVTFVAGGRVFDITTRRGLPELVVTFYDIGDHARGTNETGLAEASRRATRIGSVATDAEGAFTFRYDAHDIAAVAGGKQRLDLLLVVTVPDRAGTEAGGDGVLYVSDPRLAAGREERFSIGIAEALVHEKGLDEAISVGTSLHKYERSFADSTVLQQGVSDIHRAGVERQIAEKKALRAQFVDQMVTRADAMGVTGVVLGEGDAIPDKVDEVGTKAVAVANGHINNGDGVRVNLYLTPEDRNRLAPFFAAAVDGIATIPEHELEGILFRPNSSENPGTLLVHQNPFLKYCAEASFDESCAKFHTGLADEDPHDHGDGGGTGGGGSNGSHGAPAELTNADLLAHVTRLLEDAPSPDAVLGGEFNNQRATTDAVQDSVDNFSLRRGPAEVPAFYDFHSLQIAFEHVWKILVDEEAVNSAYALDKKFRARASLGLQEAFSQTWMDFQVKAPIYELIPTEVPAEVAAQFDITLEEWIDLGVTHQKKLQEIAAAMAAACAPVTTSVGFFTVTRTPPNCEKRRQDLREQGERLIDAIRHDDYYTMHKTLRDLHERINSNYEFTVFAADRNSHSVNFGLLNTYRQQWTPLNYQAGRLVRTLPLSPKEERKYSLKVTRAEKQARKEALKNSSSLKGEQGTTARVEAEIMQKAQNKTNFSLSAEGTYNIGISKGKSTTTFGVEAQQESAATRRDFREAVHKAVQEYNEERNVQVDVEETTSSEYTESGTVVNPNDELSVTYLFYDLQRTYRIEEALYRTLPVVLVAEEVPAPHQITEAWVIAHDWIINRHLLDDSFRPALDYLASKSVGDDFGLRELRKNLRQQRNLVESLRLELSVASNEAENRYAALERAIQKRIGEESAERTDGWFSDVGDFFGGGGQDPEAAKARELAAQDAHRHAVERAEKIATALQQEVGNLHVLTATYNQTLEEHLDNETRVKRLLVHLRNNILYYLQAIWSMEPPDQRFLRLHKVQVPQLDLAQVADPQNSGVLVPARSYAVEVNASEDIFEAFREPGTTKHKAFMTGRLEPITAHRPLVEVADLDTLLGFKGNYLIFPLKEHNALTEFMAAPYVDAAFGAMDPDELSNVSLDDYSRYVCCLHDTMTEQQFDELKPTLRQWLALLLADPLRNGDQIVVPADSLYIEILTGAHPLLENFKLRHRELDVYKVQAEVRRAELENLRLAARLLNDEREDPDIERKIVVEGAVPIVVDPGDT